ncbi:MAG: noncanonical pyrimidine nucleotidase, YjjG family [Bacteroidetes bacterium GWA2_30_7]|nr:MAG: noncanonical pyrimidine nucleotidase, YjjG family [Bacteroidetes bacterium GWA2_30_7]
MNEKYKHVFLDLDNTLWDFKSNSHETIKFLFKRYKLSDKILDFDLFYCEYQKVNANLWQMYREAKIEKNQLRWKRFYDTFLLYGIVDLKLAESFGNDYVEMSPQKTIMFPYAFEIVEYLSKKYELYILTNGFKEVQYIKLENTGLNKFFRMIFTSEEIGFQKPNSQCFDKALLLAGAENSETIMIGDDLEIDILGAKNVGIDQVFFNHEKRIHNEQISYEIESLKEIFSIL